MDEKEKNIFLHYKRIIEDDLFDEYDILGFLIFIRRHLRKDRYPTIRDYSDLIAHRKRNKGLVFDNLKIIINNNYRLTPVLKKVVGFNGVSQKKWKKEWNNFSDEFSVKITPKILKGITMCIFSLANCSKYCKGNSNIGKIRLGQDKDSNLVLLITEGKSDSLHVCFSKWGKYHFHHETIFIDESFSAVRLNGVLCLMNNSGQIICEC